MEARGSIEHLYEQRQQVRLLRRAQSALIQAGKTDMARGIGREAGILAEATFWVPVTCPVHKGEFDVSVLVGDDGPVGPRICPSCSAIIDAHMDNYQEAIRTQT